MTSEDIKKQETSKWYVHQILIVPLFLFRQGYEILIQHKYVDMPFNIFFFQTDFDVESSNTL